VGCSVWVVGVAEVIPGNSEVVFGREVHFTK